MLRLRLVLREVVEVKSWWCTYCGFSGPLKDKVAVNWTAKGGKTLAQRNNALDSKEVDVRLRNWWSVCLVKLIDAVQQMRLMSWLSLIAYHCSFIAEFWVLSPIPPTPIIPATPDTVA